MLCCEMDTEHLFSAPMEELSSDAGPHKARGMVKPEENHISSFFCSQISILQTEELEHWLQPTSGVT